jgi:hypothetical protein
MGKGRSAFILALVGVLLAASQAHAPNTRGPREKSIIGVASPERVKSDAQ